MRVAFLEQLKQLIEQQVNFLTTPHSIDLSVPEESIDEHDTDAKQLAQNMSNVLHDGPTLALRMAIADTDELQRSLLDKKPDDVVARLEQVIELKRENTNDNA